MSEEIQKVSPSQYWTVLPTSTDWALFTVDPDGRHGAYIKGDGGVHIWEYDHEKRDMSEPSPTRTWHGTGKEDFTDEDAEYRIIDIDIEILRLLALRETAIRHFQEYGCEAAREEWYYGKPLGMVTMGKHIPVELETTPARSKEQPAIIALNAEKETL